MLAAVLLSAALAAPAQRLKDFSTPTPVASGSTLIIGLPNGAGESEDKTDPANGLAIRLRALELPGVYVETAGHAQRRDVFRFITQASGRDREGRCLAEGCRDVRLILYGWGEGAEAITKIARELNHIGVPVALEVGVDAAGECGGTVPPNVARAANACLDERWAEHGRKQIHAIDPTKTVILANLRRSREGRWRDIAEATPLEQKTRDRDSQLEADPLLWNHVEDFILEELHRAGIPGAPAPPPH